MTDYNKSLAWRDDKSKKDPGYIPPSTNPNLRRDNFLMYMYLLALFASLQVIADLDRERIELVKASKYMFMDANIHCVFRIYSFTPPITPNEENHSTKYHQNVQGF